VVVLVIAIALSIFFGAWAVSADIEGQYDGIVSSRAGQGALAGAPSPLDPSAATEDRGWLSGGLLFACPLH
jgi:hypothetical protein